MQDKYISWVKMLFQVIYILFIRSVVINLIN